MFCPACGQEVSDQANFCQYCGQALHLTGPAAAGATVRPAPLLAYAGFWRRFLAFGLDMIIIFFVCTGAGAILAYLLGVKVEIPGNLPTGMRQAAADSLGYLAGMVLSWLYWAVLESSEWQATLGKMALGLKVTDIEGEPISFGRATGRYFGKIISAVIFCIGFLMAGWTEKKQALHDFMAGTLVVKKRVADETA